MCTNVYKKSLFLAQLEREQLMQQAEEAKLEARLAEIGGNRTALAMGSLKQHDESSRRTCQRSIMS